MHMFAEAAPHDTIPKWASGAKRRRPAAFGRKRQFLSCLFPEYAPVEDLINEDANSWQLSLAPGPETSSEHVLLQVIL